MKSPGYLQLGDKISIWFQVSHSLLGRLQERSLVLLGGLRPQQTLLSGGLGRVKGLDTKMTFTPSTLRVFTAMHC